MMIKRPFFVFSIFAFFLLITACQTIEQTSIEVKVPVQEEEKEITEEERIKTLFLEQLELNMSESEVRGLFGTSFSLIENAMQGNESWRYDFGTRQGYKFDDQGIDQVDMEGLKMGDIQQQLFIDWSKEGNVISAALYMRSTDGDGYFEFELLADNTRGERLYHY